MCNTFEIVAVTSQPLVTEATMARVTWHGKKTTATKQTNPQTHDWCDVEGTSGFVYTRAMTNLSNDSLSQRNTFFCRTDFCKTSLTEEVYSLCSVFLFYSYATFYRHIIMLLSTGRPFAACQVVDLLGTRSCVKKERKGK